MSDNNELSLLEDELGDDNDYDLANEDEDALLADDFEIQTSTQRDIYLSRDDTLEGNQDEFQEYEEPLDDVLDLGVTDGLDDLDSEIQDHLEDTSLSGKKKSIAQDKKYVQRQNFSLQEDANDSIQDVNSSTPQTTSFEVNISAEDAPTHLESEEEDEGEAEGRDRFKAERTNIVSLKSGKSYGNIPDSLDNVISPDEVSSQKHMHKGAHWRGRRGRGSGPRGGMRAHFHHGPGPLFGPGIGPRGPGGFVHHPMHQQQQPQQQLQQIQQQPMQQLPQPPHKILINPHFRGAVQPHPDAAKLIWDMGPGMQPSGDGLLQFPPKTFPDSSPYGAQPQVSYEAPFHQQEPIQSLFNNMQGPPQHQPQQYYHEPYAEQHQQQQPHPPGTEYWEDGPPQIHLGHPNIDAFYAQQRQHGDPGMYNVQQYPDHNIVMPHEELPFQHPGEVGHMQGAPQVPGIFRLPTPAGGPRPGMRFRQPGQGPFRNFNQHRPRFQGRMNGPRARRPPGSPIAQQQPQPQQLQQKVFTSPQKRPSFEMSANTIVVPTQIRSEPFPKRKKNRMCDKNNLHEVQTVDTLPAAQTEVVDENEDEETKEYRKKIEEQKRLRERILQQKEARRKLAALEKQRELQQKDLDLRAAGDAPAYFIPNVDPPQGNAIATIVNRNTVEPQPMTQVRQNVQAVHHPPAGRGFVPQQTTVPGCQENMVVVPQSQVQHIRMRGRGRGSRGRGRGVGRGAMIMQQQRMQQPHQQQIILQQQQQQQLQQQQQQQQHQHQIAAAQVAGTINQGKTETVQVMRKKGGPPVVAAPNQRIVRAVAPPAPKRVVLNQNRMVQTNPNRTVVMRGAAPKPALQVQQQPAQLQQQQQQQQQQRRVVQKTIPPQLATQVRPVGNIIPTRKVVSTQTVGITVTAQPQETVVLPRTKVVGVENLAAGTSEGQLRRMCLRVGTVEKIRMIPTQRKALITFTNPSSAAMFFKKYQRKMVDLSLITVKLIVQQ